MKTTKKRVESNHTGARPHSRGKLDVLVPGTLGGDKASRQTRTKTDTILFTLETVQSWKSPPFQRPLRVNEKVRALIGNIKADGGVVPGVITLGALGKETYLLDGQHRLRAWELAEVPEGYADVRICSFSDMAEMGEEYVNLNSRLVNLRPDDVLKGLEESLPVLRIIRKNCLFVGYDYVRRGTRSPILSMSVAIRAWTAAGSETPAPSGSAMYLARDMSATDAKELCEALTILEKAWGRDLEYARLWAAANLVLVLWLYRKMVVTQYTPATTKLQPGLFLKCAMSLSADRTYVDWLAGRNAGDRDRSPTYARIRSIFAKRYIEETSTKLRVPSPPWSKSH